MQVNLTFYTPNENFEEKFLNFENKDTQQINEIITNKVRDIII